MKGKDAHMGQASPQRRGREAGFSMTEVMIAAIVATILLMAVAAALTAGINATQTVKGNEQATGLANKVIEDARNTAFSSLVLDSATLPATGTTDPNGMTQVSGAWKFTPISGGAAETVESASNGTVKRQTTTVIQNVTFTVYTYITLVDTGSETLDVGVNRTRRVTAIVTYQQGGATHTARSATIITRSRRGLPEPKFDLSPVSQTITTAPGATAVFTHTVRNLGVTDTYDLSVTASRSWTFTFYEDTNGDGFFEATGDTQLTDTNGNTAVDTGSLATNASKTVFAVSTIAAGEATGTVTASITFTSGAHSTVSQTAGDTAQVTWGYEVYYPYNQLQFSNTPVDSNLVGTFTNTDYPFPMPMDQQRPGTPDGSGVWQPFTSLPNYGLGQTWTGPGRPVLQRSAGTPAGNAALTAADAPYVAVWEHKVPSATYGPYAYMVLYVANVGTDDASCGRAINLRMYVNKVVAAPNASTSAGGTVTTLNGATGTPVYTASGFPVPGVGAKYRSSGSYTGCEFTPAFFWYPTLPTTAFASTLTPAGTATSNWLQVRVTVDDAARTDPVLFAYGVWYDANGQRNLDGPTWFYISRQS